MQFSVIHGANNVDRLQMLVSKGKTENFFARSQVVFFKDQNANGVNDVGEGFSIAGLQQVTGGAVGAAPEGDSTITFSPSALLAQGYTARYSEQFGLNSRNLTAEEVASFSDVSLTINRNTESNDFPIPSPKVGNGEETYRHSYTVGNTTWVLTEGTATASIAEGSDPLPNIGDPKELTGRLAAPPQTSQPEPAPASQSAPPPASPPEQAPASPPEQAPAPAP